MCTYPVGTQQRKRWLATFISPFITARKVSTGLSSHVSILHIVQFYFLCWYYDYLTETTKRKYKLFFLLFLAFVFSQNIKLNLITWWICFSFKKVDRRSALIHDLPRLRQLKGQEKWTAFILYRAQRTNVYIETCWTIRMSPVINKPLTCDIRTVNG